jgi:hypothetical protein
LQEKRKTGSKKQKGIRDRQRIKDIIQAGYNHQTMLLASGPTGYMNAKIYLSTGGLGTTLATLLSTRPTELEINHAYSRYK